MEGNWLYDLLCKNGLAESTSEWLSIIINAILAVLVLVAATLIIRRILLSVSRKWISANRYHWDDALSVFDLRPFQNPTGYDMQHLAQAPEALP